MQLSRHTLRCTFLIACLLLPRTLPAAEATLPPEVQQKLAALQAGYEAYLLKNASAPYEESLRALNAKVRPALERESRAAAQRKDLDGLVRIKADLEHIDKNELLPDVGQAQLARHSPPFTPPTSSSSASSRPTGRPAPPMPACAMTKVSRRCRTR